MAQWDGRRGLLITANIGNVTLLQITRNLLAAGPLHARTKEELGITLAIFDFMRGRRNGLVHGTPAFDENGNLAGKLATFSAKDGSGTVTVRSLNVTESYLEQMIADIAKCGEFIADGIRKIQNERKFLADETINHRWRLDDYVFGYRAPAIDTDLLRTHLKTLHSRYSSDP